MSKIRKHYFCRLFLRVALLLACAVLAGTFPEAFSVLSGLNFFKKFSVLHLLWGIWMTDMILQVVPIKNRIPLGSQKLFANRFRPIREKINVRALKKHIADATKAAYGVFWLWGALIAGLGFFYFRGVIPKIGLFLTSVLFYVCDLVCVLIWCPFRLIMKNKCCTTCRIFNWDHLMMFSPLIFIGGFYSLSLVVMAFLAFLVWELSVFLYPERFWEVTNAALKCTECTDKLCTQYCKKLR